MCVRETQLVDLAKAPSDKCCLQMQSMEAEVGEQRKGSCSNRGYCFCGSIWVISRSRENHPQGYRRRLSIEFIGYSKSDL